jgi:hypothetical protein
MKLNAGSDRDEQASTIHKHWHRTILLACVVLWLVAVGAGLHVLWSYENAPGVSANPPIFWPAASDIRREKNRWTLVMLIHPQCPCSQATIRELALIMAHSQRTLTANVLFLRPAKFSEDWEKTNLWWSAASIPGVNVIIDRQGTEARHFNATTSGQTILYDAEGQLQFSGGITASRGHSGDNAGRAAIVSLVNARATDQKDSFVFGCPLFDRDSECLNEDYGSIAKH